MMISIGWYGLLNFTVAFTATLAILFASRHTYAKWVDASYGNYVLEAEEEAQDSVVDASDREQYKALRFRSATQFGLYRLVAYGLLFVALWGLTHWGVFLPLPFMLGIGASVIITLVYVLWLKYKAPYRADS